jgi:cytosine deaminase
MQDNDLHPARVITGTLPDGSLADLHLSSGADGVVRVRSIQSHRPDTGATVDGRLDLRGHVLTAPAAEPHAHLDKALSWRELAPPLGDLDDAIACWRAGSASLTEDSFRHRALTAVAAMLRNGITAIRTHVDVLDDEDPLRGVRALRDVRDRLRGLVDLEIAVLAGPGTPTHHIEAALEAGAQIIGGAPHIADGPVDEVIRLVDLAEKHGTGIDLHVDEFLDGDHLTVSAYAERVTDWPASMSRTAGHCSRLATLPPTELDKVAAQLARAAVSVVALPITNLYLLGRHGSSTGRRGITAIDVLRHHGVLVAAGADNIRDPFNPVGRADPLETASLLITAAHQTPSAASELVTSSARKVLGLDPAGPQVGARADFLAVQGSDLLDVIAAAPADRVVIVNGAVVARTATTSWSALPTSRQQQIPAPCVMENV